MVELMVVIVIVGLLTTLIIVGANRAIYSSRAAYTRQIMSNALRGVDMFATENPLRLIYGQEQGRGFAPYPPYVPANAKLTGNRSVSGLLFSNRRGVTRPRLSEILARDLGRSTSERLNDWVRLGRSQRNQQDGNDDIRALYAYLRAFMPEALKQVPEKALKPIKRTGDPNDADLMNPRGRGPAPGEQGNAWIDILGIHDAWDVPLDYFLYIKVEYRAVREPGGTTQWRYAITDRIPVLRSRGVKRETYDAWIDALEKGTSAQEAATFNRPGDWIFSSELPKPWFPQDAFADRNQGTFDAPEDPPPSGWLRAVPWFGRNGQAMFKADMRYLPSDDAYLTQGN